MLESGLTGSSRRKMRWDLTKMPILTEKTPTMNATAWSLRWACVALFYFLNAVAVHETAIKPPTRGVVRTRFQSFCLLCTWYIPPVVLPVFTPLSQEGQLQLSTNLVKSWIMILAALPVWHTQEGNSFIRLVYMGANIKGRVFANNGEFAIWTRFTSDTCLVSFHICFHSNLHVFLIYFLTVFSRFPSILAFFPISLSFFLSFFLIYLFML